jgi:Asp-tRNA(Asn)/Glu-tRNA(Gln) amidotransferase A subunit family amidase
LQIASILLNSDGCHTFKSFFRTGERNDSGAAQMARYMALPRALKYLHYLWVRYVRRDAVWAGLLRHWHPLTAAEQWTWVAQREAYRARWHAWWADEAALDFLITVPNATPAVPHGGMRAAVSSCGYTFLFNLLDYACGVLPVTRVDRALDGLPNGFAKRGLNGVASGAYAGYDADAMHGLPVGVQVVGRRLEEERVLAFMGRVEGALGRTEERYRLLEIE